MSKKCRKFSCRKDPNLFCYVCGKYTTEKKRNVFSDVLQKQYKDCYNIYPENINQYWAPSSICHSCQPMLSQCSSTLKRHLEISKPDCYFCLSTKSGFGKHMRWCYPTRSGAGYTHPVLYSDGSQYTENTYATCNEVVLSSSTSSVSYKSHSLAPKLYTQAQVNDLVRDLELSKEKSELLASHLKDQNFLERNVNTTVYRIRHKPYSDFFTTKDNMYFCYDIHGLFDKLRQTYDARDWRIFVDSSKESLKAVLLHNGNQKPSIPIAHAVNMKESHETMTKLFKNIDYENHDWKVCCDLKVVAILVGLQGGFTKHCCFLCLWDSRVRHKHYVQKDWPPRLSNTIGVHNIKHMAVVKKDNIILPPLHIKLGLVKNFIKALDKEGEAFSKILHWQKVLKAFLMVHIYEKNSATLNLRHYYHQMRKLRGVRSD